jgi:hypothetical protein
MNDLIKVKDLLDNQEYLKAAGAYALHLNQVSQIASFDTDLALSALNDADPLFGLKHLRDSVLHDIFQNKELVMERHVQFYFFDNLDKYLPGASRLDLEMHSSHRPDGFVVLADGAIAPVEVKLNKFTQKSLSQLKRYMSVYGLNKGVAVAPILRCVLPENVVYVQVKRRDVRRQKG